MIKNNQNEDEKTCETKKGDIVVWKKIGGKMIPLSVCKKDGNEIYHDTTFDELKSILESGYLRPNPRRSNAVSFSMNFLFVYQGNIKMVFWRDKIIDMLEPMMYHHQSGHIPDENCEKEIFYDENEYSDDYKIIGGELDAIDKNTNRARAKTRIGDRKFWYECEWLSHLQVKVNDTTVKKILYIIPYIIRKDLVGGNAGCATWGSGEIRIDDDASIDDLVRHVSSVKDLCKKHGIPFGGIYTDYKAIIINDESGTYVNLDDENLRRIEDGKRPFMSKKGKKIGWNEFPCIDDDEMLKRREK